MLDASGDRVFRNRGLSAGSLLAFAALAVATPFQFPPFFPATDRGGQLGAALIISWVLWVFWSVGPGVKIQLSESHLKLFNWVWLFEIPYSDIDSISSRNGVSVTPQIRCRRPVRGAGAELVAKRKKARSVAVAGARAHCQLKNW